MRGTSFVKALLVFSLAAACSSDQSARGGSTATVPTTTESFSGASAIRHVVVMMQENRSFDSYFGTFPGVDGLPMKGGQPTVCSPNPATGACDTPYHDAN